MEKVWVQAMEFSLRAGGEKNNTLWTKCTMCAFTVNARSGLFVSFLMCAETLLLFPSTHLLAGNPSASLSCPVGHYSLSKHEPDTHFIPVTPAANEFWCHGHKPIARLSPPPFFFLSSTRTLSLTHALTGSVELCPACCRCLFYGALTLRPLSASGPHNTGRSSEMGAE